MPRGVRLNPKHDKKTREKIKISQILNMLYLHVIGEVNMKPSQIKSAEILLKKSLPDLVAVAHTEVMSSNSLEDVTPNDRKVLIHFMKHYADRAIDDQGLDLV